MTFERHQINLFLTLPLFAEKRWYAFPFFIWFRNRNEKILNRQTVSNINERGDILYFILSMHLHTIRRFHDIFGNQIGSEVFFLDTMDQNG